MNLASRCREAISHVAMLKKKLAMHQRRAAEALALQRKHQSETKSEPLPVVSDDKSPVSPRQQRSKNLSDVAAEMDRMDRILAAHAANGSSSPHLQPEDEKKEDKVLNLVPENKKTKNLSITPVSRADSGAPEEPPSPKMVDSDDFEFDEEEEDQNSEPRASSSSSSPPKVEPKRRSMRNSPVRSSPNSDLMATEKETKEDEDTVQETTPRFSDPPFFPHSASPKFHRGSYNEEFPGDITAVSKPAARQKHHMLGDCRESDDENPASKSSSHHGVFETMSKREDKSTMSSIDAFEASFNTNFPDSFSPKDDTEEKKPSSGIYNPFFPSPQKSVRSSDSSAESGPPATSAGPALPATVSGENGFAGSIRDRAARSAKRMGVTRSKSTDPPAHNRTSPRDASSAKAISSMSARPVDNSSGRSPPQRRYSPSTPRTNASPLRSEMLDDDRYRTPPQQKITTPTTSSEEPQRPEKAGYDVARARYEKALQPRGSARIERPPEMPSDEKSYPARTPPEPRSSPSQSREKVSVKDRVAAFSSGFSPQTQEKDKVPSGWVGTPERKQRVVYPLLDDENEGEIPMNSSLSPKDENGDRKALFQEPSPSVRSQINGSTVALTNGISRVRPWEDLAQNENQKIEVESEGPNTSSSHFANAGKQRRNVKQPTSYVEPSIGSKLRRGDVYLAKEEAPVNAGSREYAV